MDTKGFNRILFYSKCPCGRGHLQNHEKSTVWRGGVPHKQKPADIALVITAPRAAWNWSQKDIKTLAATRLSISRIMLGLCSQISLVSHLMF
jgi:hypothetical protein